MKKENEVEMYALHLLQKNDLKKVMSDKTKKVLKKYDLAVTPSPNPQMFLTTILFHSPEERKKCGTELEELGIAIAYEVAPAYVDRKYVGDVQ